MKINNEIWLMRQIQKKYDQLEDTEIIIRVLQTEKWEKGL